MQPIVLSPGAVPLAAWRQVAAGRAGPARSGRHAGGGARGGGGRADRRPRRAGLRRQHRLRQARAACASPPTTSRSCSATSCCRTPPGVGAAMPRADRPADDGAQAGEPRRRAPPACGRRRWRCWRRCWRAALLPVDPGAGLGRRLGRPRAAGAHGGGDDRRRRDARCDGAGLPAAEALAAAGLAPLTLAAEGGAGAAQRHAVLHRLALAGLFEAEALLRSRRWSPARSSTDAARGSDAPFDRAHPRAARPPRPDRRSPRRCAR